MTKRNESARSAQETARLVSAWERSGLTQREYCDGHGIAPSTFDYYRRRARQQEPSEAAARLLPVCLVSQELEPEPKPGGFVLVLVNGRRIEGGWAFAEEGLRRLLRVAEQA